MRKPVIKSECWDAQQVADYLGLALSTIYHGGADTNQIDKVYFGRAPRWRRADVEAFAERKHQEAVNRRNGRRFPRGNAA